MNQHPAFIPATSDPPSQEVRAHSKFNVTADARRQEIQAEAHARVRAADEASAALGLSVTPETCEVVCLSLQAKIATNAFDVFMAHHSVDKPFVLDVGELLRLQGIYPWIDIEQIQPGRWFQDGIQSAIRTVRSAAIFLGSDGLGPWQLLEIRAFVERCLNGDIPVIPVLLPGVTTIHDQLTFLKELNPVRFTRDAFDPAALRNLLWGITSVRPDDQHR